MDGSTSVTGEPQELWFRRRLCLGMPSPLAISNSSSWRPDCSAATSHLGCLPRPDHVSAGADGLQYFGRIFGYFRLGCALLDSLEGDTMSLICSARFSCARRFSNSRFSTLIFSARTFVNSSCKIQ